MMKTWFRSVLFFVHVLPYFPSNLQCDIGSAFHHNARLGLVALQKNTPSISEASHAQFASLRAHNGQSNKHMRLPVNVWLQRNTLAIAMVNKHYGWSLWEHALGIYSQSSCCHIRSSELQRHVNTVWVPVELLNLIITCLEGQSWTQMLCDKLPRTIRNLKMALSRVSSNRLVNFSLCVWKLSFRPG